MTPPLVFLSLWHWRQVASRAEATGFQSGVAWAAVPRKMRRMKERRGIWGAKITYVRRVGNRAGSGVGGLECKICVCNV